MNAIILNIHHDNIHDIDPKNNRSNKMILIAIMLEVIITVIKYKVTKVFFYDKTTFTSIVAAANQKMTVPFEVLNLAFPMIIATAMRRGKRKGSNLIHID